MSEFQSFPKIPRLSRECIVTEKIDGANASVFIGENGEFLTGSRTQWITPERDNHGFAGWAYYHKDELMKLGPGHHFGEWWGLGIQRGYGLQEKRFSLFNTSRWDVPERPACCGIVPVLWRGIFSDFSPENVLNLLRREGSRAAPGFMKPEGIVIFHVQGRILFKKTLEKDSEPKAIANGG